MRNMLITSVVIYNKDRDEILLCKDKNLWDATVIPSVISLECDDTDEIVGKDEASAIVEIGQNLSVDLGKVIFVDWYIDSRYFNGIEVIVNKKLFICPCLLEEPNNNKKAYSDIVWEPVNKYRLSYNNQNQALQSAINYIDCMKFDTNTDWGIKLNTMLYKEMYALPYKEIEEKDLYNSTIDGDRKVYMHILNKNIPEEVKDYCKEKIVKLNNMYKN